VSLIPEANNQITSSVRNMKYGEGERTWKVSDKVTIGWKSVLPMPPENTSNFTIQELVKMSEITENLTSNQLDLIYMVDDDPNHVFSKLIKKHGMKDHTEEFKKAWAITDPIIMNLKWKFNRPRPYQLAAAYGIDIKVTETKTHHTPAYPSGHSAWAAMMGYILAEHYPQHSSEIFDKIDLAGKARVLQGVHYPSDNDASMVITGALWQDIKHYILGE
jgi:hypothetical protein